MQPAAQGVAGADRMGFPGEDEKGGLKRILGVVLALELSPAGGKDHRPMTRNQGFESDRVFRI